MPTLSVTCFIPQAKDKLPKALKKMTRKTNNGIRAKGRSLITFAGDETP